LQYRGIDADPTLIVLDRRPQDARILVMRTGGIFDPASGAAASAARR
jgi:hypothetical protein